MSRMGLSDGVYNTLCSSGADLNWFCSKCNDMVFNGKGGEIITMLECIKNQMNNIEKKLTDKADKTGPQRIGGRSEVFGG